MTLGEGKRKVLMLLDEYSAGGEITKDEDISKKMADFFDMAQKDVAGYKPILQSVELFPDGSGSSCELPEDFVRLSRVWRNGALTGRYGVTGRRLIVPAGDRAALVVEYHAKPKTIEPDAEDDYEFEVDEDAANCLPFYVAAQQLMPDLVVDYSVFRDAYYNMRAALDVSTPPSGGDGVRQAMFSGRRRR